MAIIGPGSIQQDEIAPLPTLTGASEYEYVTILNPLPDDFAVRVAQDVPVNMPLDIRAKTGLIREESDVVRNYGLDLKNPDFKARKHLVNDTVIKSGQTINLKGSEAQVAVRQLVNEILQREGKSRLMSDPHLRKEAEDKIIKHRGSIQDLMENNLRSTRSQIDEAINQSNGEQDEQAFPGVTRLGEASGDTGAAKVDTANNNPGEQKRMGRPKKENS